MPIEINALDATIFRIRECLEKRQFGNAVAIIEGFAERADPSHRFEGYAHSNKLPLMMIGGSLDQRVLNALDAAGIETIGDLRETPTHILAELPRNPLTTKTVREARVAARNLAVNFDRWKAKREKREAEQC